MLIWFKTQTWDPPKSIWINYFSSVDEKTVSTSDVAFFEEGIKKSQDVFPDKTEDVHADGAYDSPSNQQFCIDKVLTHTFMRNKEQMAGMSWLF